MKLIITIFLIFINLELMHQNFLKNTVMRNKVQSLACNLYFKTDEIKILDESIAEFSKENKMHNNLYIYPEKYKSLLDQMKSNKELALEFLVIKMMYGDTMAAKIYIDLKNSKTENTKENTKEINEKEVLDRVRKIVELTDGIGAANHAKYLAFEYMKNYDKQKNNTCRINLLKTGISFLERRSTRAKTKDWEHIKFYEEPQNGRVRDVKYWMKENEHFPTVMLYGEQYPNDCNYDNSKTIKFVNDLNDIKLHSNCFLQIIGKQSDEIKNRHEISVMIDNKPHTVKFWVSNDKLDYNCIGWAVGLQDFMETYIFTEPRGNVKDLKAFKLYMKQYREALKMVENKLTNTGEGNRELMTRIINKRKPEPSLIMSLLKDEDVLDKLLVGLEDEITTKMLYEICDSQLDGAVLFYGQKNEFSHGAKYVSKLKAWTSKLGSSFLITHDLHFLSDTGAEKSLYGKPKFLFCPVAVNKGAAGIKHDRTDFS